MNSSYAQSVLQTEHAERVLEYRMAAKAALGNMLREVAGTSSEAKRTQHVVEDTTATVEKHLRELDATNFDALLVSVELVTRSILDMINGHTNALRAEGKTDIDINAFATGYTSAVAEVALAAVLAMSKGMNNKGTVQ